MEPKLVLCIGCVSLALFCSSASLACRGNCADANVSPCATQVASACSDPKPNCSCGDQVCYSGNPCLSSSQCCEVFGNIGQIESPSSCNDY